MAENRILERYSKSALIQMFGSAGLFRVFYSPCERWRLPNNSVCFLTTAQKSLKILPNVKGRLAMVGRCSCGNVEFEVLGEPILCASCHCADCHEGSRRIEALPNAAPILDSYGGTQHVVFRKDRVKFLKGTEFLKTLKVDDDSPKRVYAECCNSYVLLDIPSPMPAVPIYRGRFEGKIPQLEMRINAKFKPNAVNIPYDVPSYSSFPLKFVRKLIGAKIAMFFGA
jgi:hypothetical protein